MRPLSYSSISLYQQCPLRFKFRYIDGLKEEPKFYFSFGHSLHNALKFLYSYIPPPPTLEELLAYYEDNWEREGYEDEKAEKKYFEYGKDILTEFYNIHVDKLKTPLGVEYNFHTDIHGIPVTGYVDRIDKLDEGTIEIIDYKSGKYAYDKKDVLKNDQLTFYQLGVEQCFDMKIGKLTIYHLPTQTAVSSSPRPREEIDKMISSIVKVAEDIENEKFEPITNKWCPCDFAALCPYYKHLYMEEEKEIGEVVEEYAALKMNEKKIKEEIDKLAGKIHEYCETKNVLRVFGEKHLITRGTVKHIGYDERSLKELLEPLGLWDRVLKYDDSLTKQLLKDPNISRELKDDIKKLEKVISSYPVLRHRERKERERLEDFDFS